MIWQTRLIRQRDVPLKPGHSVTLEYDAADSPLAGIVVCRPNADCRLLAVNSSDAYYIETFDELAPVEPAWLVAIQSHPRYDFVPLVLLMFCFVPIALFLSWLYLGKAHQDSLAGSRVP